ncbi:hypothetical protein Pfo_009550 [Paulownia fortunei]|nr:hypothetical protein Pfo_009550 [Paulownia fortunei]
MDFLSNFSKSDEPKPNADDSNNPDHHRKPSKSDLLHSAKVVADVAQAHFRHEPEKYDKAEAAGATADLLNAAAEYGKLGDKGVGKYVDKAEDYLRHYHTSQSGGNPGGHKTTQTTEAGEHFGGGGYKDDGKMGEGFSKRPSHGGEGGGGAGDFMKMAGDFLKK